jgi:hypothetical protein
MNRQAWYLVGIVALVAIGTGYIVRNKTGQTDSEAATNSQLPADDAQANYTVPPNIGESGQSVPTVNDGNITYTASQGNALPTT